MAQKANLASEFPEGAATGLNVWALSGTTEMAWARTKGLDTKREGRGVLKQSLLHRSLQKSFTHQIRIHYWYILHKAFAGEEVRTSCICNSHLILPHPRWSLGHLGALRRAALTSPFQQQQFLVILSLFLFQMPEGTEMGELVFPALAKGVITAFLSKTFNLPQ